jgi:LacI family transcriptional regulator
VVYFAAGRGSALKIIKAKDISMANMTLEQIAELAHVSRSTVSRVINDHASVRPEVRQRVWEVIEETGYQPNMAARSLASRRTGIIGLVIPRNAQAIFTDPYFPRLIQGITQACNASDYTLSLFLFHDEEEERKLHPRVLRHGYVDGVIITSFHTDDPLIPQLQENGMPFVVIGRPPHTQQTSFIDVDNVNGAYTAVNHLLRQGRRRIATITGPLNTVVGQDRLQGYRQALQERGIPFDEALVKEGMFTETEARYAMSQLLAQQPDAVFAASDAMAFGALQTLHEASIAVPDQIALVGFDDIPVATVTNPPLTTIRQPIRRTGALAVETLIDLFDNGPQPPRQIILTTQLVIRGSCGAQTA